MNRTNNKVNILLYVLLCACTQACHGTYTHRAESTEYTLPHPPPLGFLVPKNQKTNQGRMCLPFHLFVNRATAQSSRQARDCIFTVSVVDIISWHSTEFCVID